MPLQCEDQFQVFAFFAVVQKAIVADFPETGWQYMHQITANEFFMGQSNCSARFSVFFTSCGEGNLMFCNRQNPAVGDGDLMGVSSEIFNGVSKAVESLFDIRTPCFFIKLIPEFRLLVLP